MATIEVEFEFSDGSTDCNEFEGNSSVLSDIADYADGLVDDKNDDSPEDAEEIVCDGWSVIGSDSSDYTGQKDWDYFGGEDDLDAWGEYSERVDEFGEPFVLRHDDWDGHENLDDYHGCWASEEEFAQSLYEDCHGSSNDMYCYIDWEHYARDVMMDFSSYEGDDGYHIFSDH